MCAAPAERDACQMLTGATVGRRWTRLSVRVCQCCRPHGSAWAFDAEAVAATDQSCWTSRTANPRARPVRPDWPRLVVRTCRRRGGTVRPQVACGRCRRPTSRTDHGQETLAGLEQMFYSRSSDGEPSRRRGRRCRGPPGSLGCRSSAGQRARWRWRRRRSWRHSPMVGPRTEPSPDRRRPGHPHRVRGARRHPGAGRPAAKRRASRSAATARAAGRRSSSGSPPRPRPPARSWPGSTCRAASTRSRRSPVVSGSNGSWSSPRRRSTRASPSVARCWPGARSTCSSSTCPVAGWPPRTARPASPTGSAGWRRSPGARRRSSSCSSRPVTPVAWRPPSPRRPVSASSSPGGRGSGSGATSSASGRRRWSPAIDTARRGGGRPSGSSTRRVASETPASAATTSSATKPPIQPPRSTNGPPAMRLLHLHRPHLPLELARARASEPFPPGPLVLGGRPWDPGPVVDANPEARALGVRRGMPLGSAHRLVPEATFIDPDPDADRATVEAAFEALAAFSPGIAGSADPADAAFGLFEVQVDGLEALWGPEPVLVERLVEALGRALGGEAPARSGPGSPGPASARPWPRSSPAPARRSSSRPVARPTFLAPHPSGLLTQDPDVRARLTRFGLRRIGAVAELDRTALVARFGEEGARIHARAHGEELEPFRPRRAPERLHLALPDRTRGRGSRAAPLRPPSTRRRPDRAARGARAGGRRGRGCTSTWISRSPGRGRPPSWTSSSASPSRPPTPRRSSASCSPASSGPHRRPRSPGSPWSWTARLRRPVSSSRCSRHRPPAAPGSSGSSPGLP